MAERGAISNNPEYDLFPLLMEHVQDYAVFITDAGGRVQSWNCHAERLLGYSECEVIGQSVDIFFSSEDREQKVPLQHMHSAAQTGCSFGECWHNQKCGGQFWNSGVTVPIRDHSKDIQGFAWILRNRSDRKQAEAAAKDALTYAEAIVETVREPLLILTGDLRVRSANRAFFKTFGVSEIDTHGRLLYDLGNGQWDIPELRKLLEEILPQNSSFNDFEVTHKFPSIGEKVMVLNARRINRDADSEQLVLLAIEDITERRRLENERRELETRFTSLVRNIRDHSIFTLDPDGCITSWNQEAERILGFSEAEVMGRHFSLIFTQEDCRAGVPDHELTTAKSCGRAEDERWHLRKDGELFWALGIVCPTIDSKGQHTGYSKILRDMTDRKRAEEALQLADRRKDEFLATLAHELRNPLAPIHNSLQILKLTSDPIVTEAARSMMERQLTQMVRLVDDLLDISRVTQNKMNLRKAPIELSAVLLCAIETARPQIDLKAHTLTVTLPPAPVYLYGDLTRLAQVFWNLLNNSAKYTAARGQILLDVETIGDEAILRFKDNGIGILEESMPRLFEMFSQVNRSLEQSEGGLGIGLALVKALTEAHGGSVQAHSDGPGRGSTFTVRLPILKSDTAPPESDTSAADTARDRSSVFAAAPENANVPRPLAQDEAGDAKSRVNSNTPLENTPCGPCRILVVDDNHDIAASLARLLTVMGNKIHTAHDGLEAVQVAETFRPDVIVLDIGLPKLNGYDVCRRIRLQPWSSGVLIVAATGWNQEEDRRQSKEAGFDHHLVKPVDIHLLKTLLRQHKP